MIPLKREQSFVTGPNDSKQNKYFKYGLLLFFLTLLLVSYSIFIDWILIKIASQL